MAPLQTLKEFMLKPWLYLTIVVLSLSYKIATVDNMFYWLDEVYTILHTSGETDKTMEMTTPRNEIKNISYYKTFLSLNEKDITVGSQIRSLNKMTNLNPLHYYFLVFWHRLVGDSDMNYRFFSILMFLLCLPVLFLLAKHLFNSKLAGWIAISLFALSPMFHMYSRQARYNMLSILVLILSYYLLVKAIDERKLKYWIGYTFSGVLVLYSSLTSGVILFGHFMFVLIYKRNVLKSYIISGGVILLCYLPWILSIISNRAEIHDSLQWQATTNQFSHMKVILCQLVTIGRIHAFFDTVWYLFDEKIFLPQLLASLFVLSVLVSSIIVASKKLPKETFGFLLFITIPLFLFYFTVDIIRGSFASAFERYQLGAYVGTIMFISWFLYSYIQKKKLIFTVLYLVFLILGIITTLRSTENEKSAFNYFENTASFISKADYPLIITDGSDAFNYWGNVLSVFNACESESMDILYASEDIQNVEALISKKQYSDIYLIVASEGLRKNLKSQFEDRMKVIENLKNQGIWIWEIKLN